MIQCVREWSEKPTENPHYKTKKGAPWQGRKKKIITLVLHSRGKPVPPTPPFAATDSHKQRLQQGAHSQLRRDLGLSTPSTGALPHTWCQWDLCWLPWFPCPCSNEAPLSLSVTGVVQEEA